MADYKTTIGVDVNFNLNNMDKAKVTLVADPSLIKSMKAAGEGVPSANTTLIKGSPVAHGGLSDEMAGGDA